MNTQKMSVHLEFTYEAPIYEGDADDLFRIAEDEADFIKEKISLVLDDVAVGKLDVRPIYG